MKKILLLCTVIMFTALVSCSSGKDDGKIRVIGTWGGSELETFQAMADAAGIEIEFETTRDLNAILTAKAGKDGPYDMAILPNPAMLSQLAKDGKLAELSYLNRKNLAKEFGNSLIRLGSYGGKLYGVYIKASNKSVIWYNPEEFEKNGWKVPETWNELISLTDQIRSAGKTPWSIGADIGWPTTDWIENIMVGSAGEDTYQQWVDHSIKWNDPAVKEAFILWGQIVGNKANLLGGIDGTLSSKFQDASYALFQKNPKAFLYYEGDFMGGIVKGQIPSVEFGKNMDFFAFPKIKDKSCVVGGADVIVAFNDRKKVKDFIKKLSSVEIQTVAAKKGFMAANKLVDPAVYPDKTLQKSASILAAADVFVFDASDLMPPAVGNQGGFWDKSKEFIKKPEDIDRILDEMEILAAKNYGN
ncbi:MAG: carbohydrate ABC transporter substrate-binding protein [Spirochaetes bacterium]|nr:carbohydrate ABC transporter substrate-binding protein [Spirochaetota bacterium]